MNLKRVAIIALFILAVVLGGLVLYRIFFRPLLTIQPPAPGAENTVNGGGLQPSVNGRPVTVPTNVNARPTTPPPVTPTRPAVSPTAQGGVTAVTQLETAPTVGATLAADGTLRFYNKDDGKFYRLNADGTMSTISNKTFFNVSAATFNPQGSGVILEYPDRTKFFYDFNANRQYTIPQHWEQFRFSPGGDKIETKSMTLDAENRYLVISNPDGSGAKAIQELGNNADKVALAWSPNNQIVATAATGTNQGLGRTEVYFVGQNNENFKSMMVEGIDFRPQWSPTGNNMLYSVTGPLTDWRPTLWVVDASGQNVGSGRRMLNLNTWADKCSFAGGTTLYCAVPQTLERGAGLQPDVADTTPDDIYRVDLTTGTQTKIATPEGDHTVDKLMPSSDGQYLFFTDRGSGLINKIKLAP